MKKTEYKEFYKNNGLNQKKFAVILKQTPQAVRNWENGIHPTPRAVELLIKNWHLITEGL